ncbi:helix-turn-helix domain-containing protein [Actinocorallia sp. A-T 12471]|uniref:TetR/AcrR family transcriptional regulator n=1 Tax=Actinocorallia sp. A-T 12471 TaxID=3089813 RepID=UPI0029D29F62|nr:helix-turn-helix domain-containing protein [Actinocorallia sp. A-T 12471]MDX6740702.1 helix-turn-helix domain-containing protein [Actinocorallia sp. A-T 12471]
MASPRRIGAPEAKNRTVLIDAAERLLLEEGHTAVSSRRVAAKAGLKPQLVHYYFRTMDDLILAVFRRRAEDGLAAQAAALASPQPLWALWRFSTDPHAVAITMAFVGLAGQREAVRAEIAAYSERFRAAQVTALTDILNRYDLPADRYPPTVLVLLLTAISRVLLMEEALGFTTGHPETTTLIESLIQDLEGTPLPAHPAGPGPGPSPVEG